MAPGELSQIIGDLTCDDENVLKDLTSSEDAAIYKINNDIALVQTVDIITPVVDDPYYYGQIAAANSLSDVFAMGGEVKTAMNIVGFDGCHHPKGVLKEILRGAEDKIKECKGSIVGGHTIETPEMLFGLSVTGFVNPNKIYYNNTPKIGDKIILTKPLGAGILTTALKADMIGKKTVKKIVEVLSKLNYKASQIMKNYDVHACTDVTGFGLLGHALEMIANNFTMKFYSKNIPILEESFEMADMGIIPAGTYNNKSYLKDKVTFKAHLKDDILLFDAQTSGGLLISVGQKDANKMLDELKNNGYEDSAVVAEICQKEKYSLVVI